MAPQDDDPTPAAAPAGPAEGPAVSRRDFLETVGGGGGAVWSSSAIAWCGSLSYNSYTNNVSRITENVLRRFASDEPFPAPQASAPSNQRA